MSEQKRKLEQDFKRLSELCLELDAEKNDLRAKYEKAMVCIEWFANERLYEMDSFMTASPIHQVGEMPTNIRIEGNPILKLGLKKAQECIEELGEK